MTNTVLVLGASGRFGRAAAEAFWNAGWTVRSFDRGRDRLPEAAHGADVIVYGWHPPYPRWEAEVPGLTAQVIDAARASGATVLIPGNVYVFGAGSPEVLGPETPHRATNPLGRVRIVMEAAYREAGVRTIVLRAGDFLDTTPSGNWFDAVMAKGAGRGRFVWPGDPDVPHAFAFLPDLARAAVALAEMRDRLPVFADIPFEGMTLTGRQLAGLVGEAAGREMRLARFPWWALRLARPVWPTARGILEMRYLWSMPHRLDRKAFRALVPGFRATPAAEAVAAALGHLDIDPDEPVTRGRGRLIGQRVIRERPVDA